MRSPTRPRPAVRDGALVPSLYRDLRERIVSVALEPGQSLSETRLGEHYGVSRTPVREALKRLAEDGFVEVVPQVGTFVARIDLRRVRDAHFVRDTLECRIAELASERIDAAGRMRLADNLALQRRAVAAHDGAAFFEADEAMHRLLADIAGHQAAWQVVHAAKSQLDRVRHLSLANRSRSRLRMAEHRTIVERVSAGDARGARDAMHDHLASIFDAIDSITAAHAGFFVDDAAAPAAVADRGATAMEPT